MNERIQKLVQQSGLGHMPSNYSDMADLYKGADFELEKFAHKIVEETINELCQQLHWHGIEVSNYPKFYSAIKKTEKQFGYLR